MFGRPGSTLDVLTRASENSKAIKAKYNTSEYKNYSPVLLKTIDLLAKNWESQLGYFQSTVFFPKGQFFLTQLGNGFWFDQHIVFHLKQL